MINLLPTEVKEQLKFAKFNTRIISYTIFILLFVAGLLAIIYYGTWQANNELNSIEADLKLSEDRLKKLSDTEARSKEIRGDLRLVQQIYDRESRLIEILKAIEDSIPFYSSITELELAQSTAGPLELQFNVPDLVDAAVLRVNLEANEVINAVDIQEVSPVVTDGNTRTVVTIILTVEGYSPVTTTNTTATSTAQPNGGTSE